MFVIYDFFFFFFFFLIIFVVYVAVKSQQSLLKKDVEVMKTKYNEVSEKLMEKTRQYQKLQVMNIVTVIVSIV